MKIKCWIKFYKEKKLKNNSIVSCGKQQKTMRFKRICIRCQEYFRPTGKENKICEKCKRNTGSKNNKK